MRRSLALALALAIALNGGLLATPGNAQRAGHPSASALDSAPDPLRPYGARSSGEARAEGQPYTRARSVPKSRPEAAPHPAVRSRGVGSYFPTMRTGQGPNRNVVNPHTLCVPGRRAMLQR